MVASKEESGIRQVDCKSCHQRGSDHLFLNGPIILFKWRNEENWPVEYVSPNVCDLLGYFDHEFLSGKVLYADLIDPQDLIRVEEEVSVFSGGEKRLFTHKPYRVIKSKGESIWVLDHTVILRDEEGVITHYLGYLVDITAHILQQHTIEDQKKRLEYIIEGTNIGTWEWDIQSGVTIFNDRWAEIVGYTLDELQPVTIDTWRNLVHPDDLKESNILLQKHFKGEDPYYQFECRIKHKSGKWIWVLDRGKVIEWDQQGEPVKMFGTHWDITQRKENDQEIKTLSKALEQSPSAVIITNKEGIIEYTNRAFTRLYGYEVEEVYGRNPNILKSSIQQDEYYQDLWGTITQKEEWSGELCNRGKDGRERWVRVSIAPILDNYGEITQFVAIQEDVTRLQELAMIDELTRVYNRRQFFAEAKRECSRRERGGDGYSIMMLDIDHFKKVNDTLGHDGGDIVLREVTAIMKEQIRDVDVIGRLGGEEFGIILPETIQFCAMIAAKRICETVAQTAIHVGEKKVHVTISIGVATFHKGISSFEALLKEADIALYQAKNNGRNRVVFYRQG